MTKNREAPWRTSVRAYAQEQARGTPGRNIAMQRKRTRTVWLAVVALAFALLPVQVVARHRTFVVAEPFVEYYNTHEGMRVLGYPLTDLTEVSGYQGQDYENGRIEDRPPKG